ncbi:MAG: hypothetical protein GOU98_03675 [Candidatus Altiarchaeota archaeon]|nr:hypothetical protein [Candidatus Altiarchaeota archaeon]
MLADTCKLTTHFLTLHKYQIDVSREFGLGLLDLQKSFDTITSEALTNYSTVHESIFPEFGDFLGDAINKVDSVFTKGYVFDLNGDFKKYQEKLNFRIESLSETLEYFEPENFNKRQYDAHYDRTFKSQNKKLIEDVSYKVTGNTILIYPSILDDLTNDIFKISKLVKPLIVKMPYLPKDGVWSMFDELKPIDYVVSTINDTYALEKVYYAAKELDNLCDKITDVAKDLRLEDMPNLKYHNKINLTSN